MLAEVKDVRPMVERQVRVVFPPIVLDDSQEMYVAVGLPSSAEPPRAGEGAGILATQLDRAGNSYFVMDEDGYLGRMDVEYAIDLVYANAAKTGVLGEASASNAPRVADARVQPNPFNPSVAIELQVPRTALVQVDIHDVAGRLVRAAMLGELAAGQHRHEWDGRDNRSQRVASGIYLAKIRIGDALVTRKLVLAQ